MPSKTELNSANLLQLYELHRKIDQSMNSAEERDHVTKIAYPYLPLWSMHKYVIPTRDYMSTTPAGLSTFSEWRHVGFMYTAESIGKALVIHEGSTTPAV